MGNRTGSGPDGATDPNPGAGLLKQSSRKQSSCPPCSPPDKPRGRSVLVPASSGRTRPRHLLPAGRPAGVPNRVVSARAWRFCTRAPASRRAGSSQPWLLPAAIEAGSVREVRSRHWNPSASRLLGRSSIAVPASLWITTHLNHTHRRGRTKEGSGPTAPGLFLHTVQICNLASTCRAFGPAFRGELEDCVVGDGNVKDN